MRVLVTGGAGFIGSHVVERLLGEGHAVSVVDDLSTGRREQVDAGAALHVLDLRDPGLAAVVRAAAPEAVVHLAAQASVPRSVADPLADASVNVWGTIALLEGCRQAGVGRVVYASSGGAAYGDTDVLPTPEDHPTRPASPYGASKLAAERYLDYWGGVTGVATLTLRLANVYGPRQRPHGEAGVVAIFSARLLDGQACVVNGDGEQTRDFVYVGDVADAVAAAIARPGAAGVVNLGTGVATSVNQLYRRLQQVTGVEAPARHGPPVPEQRRSVLAATRARALLGWTPRTALDDGLRQTVDHFRKERPA